MSKYMLSDHNAINDINPFVMIDFSLPGSSAKPYEFSEYTPRKEAPGIFEKEEEVIACEVNPTGTFCQNRKPNCPMSRYVLPERIFQYDDGRVNTELNGKNGKQTYQKDDEKMKMYLLLIIVLIVLFALIR